MWWTSELKRAAHHAKLAEKTKARMRRNGVADNGSPLWTVAEDSVIRSLYPDYKALQKKLPGRTYFAIRKRASIIDVVKRRVPWTAREMALFKKNYPLYPIKELCKQFPHRTALQLSSVAALKKLRKDKRKTISTTGKPLLDAIRKRAVALNYSLHDIDLIAGTKTYFESKRCRDLVRIDKAVKALDGHIEIVWHD